MNPYISLCIICGDEGTKTLSRLLASVINRDEPLAEQIVIGFNGKNEDAFREALRQYVPAQAIPGKWNTPLGRGITVQFVTFQDTWKSDFSAARNETWKHATGEWVIWLDTDDVVANAADERGRDGLQAIVACERDYGLPPLSPGTKTSTFKQWFQELPLDCNAVLAPYDYTIDQNGYVVVRQLMKRAVRKNAGHIWRNQVHEFLYPNGSVGEKSVQNLGLLVRHYPSEEVIKRVERNKNIVLKLEEKPELQVYADARHAFDRANAYMVIGDVRAADTAIKQAISLSQNLLDTYTYRLARCGICLKAGAPEAALSEALAAIGIRPSVSDAYFAASEVFFILGQNEAVIKFFELGAACSPQLGQLDQPLAMWVQPRAQAATAYLNMGNPEKALKLATEAASRYPADALVIEVLTNARRAFDKSKAVEGLLDAVEYALKNQNAVTARTLQTAMESSMPTAFRGIEQLPRYRALRTALDNLADKGLTWGIEEKAAKADAPEAKALLEKLGRPLMAAERVVAFLAGPHQSVDERALHEGTANPLVEHVPYQNGQLAVIRHASFDSNHFAFYCPYAVELWKPSDLESKPLGGSEGSVAYLARELARRGHRVTVYAPGAGSNPYTTRGVTEIAMTQFDHGNVNADVLIACRAPWVVRHPEYAEPGAPPVFAWHQDNGYDSQWSWTPEIDGSLKGSLHVSQWARQGLMKEVGAQRGHEHHVIGNGIDEFCTSWMSNANHERNPNKVIYASDPMRGLGPLLLAWPKIRERVPDAELHVFCSFKVALALAQSEPGMPVLRFRQELEQLLFSLPGVTYRGWVPHAQLIQEMQSSSVYAYPGGPMPEGFGVSLVQAAAAGCAMVYPNAGALPEVLSNSMYRYSAEELRTDTNLLAMAVGDALVYGLSHEKRVEQAKKTLMQHSWSAVADRFLKAVTP